MKLPVQAIERYGAGCGGCCLSVDGSGARMLRWYIDFLGHGYPRITPA